MTFKDLRKRVTLETAQESKAFEGLYNKPFWIWDIAEHKLEDVETNEDCCFNHIIGLPTKEGMEKAMFDYEKTLYDALLLNQVSNHNDFKHKHIWVKKATGLGITEFFLRLMV